MRVLIVEDDPDLRILLAESLERRGLSVGQAGSFAEAVAALKRHAFDGVVCDLRLPDGRGDDLPRACPSEARFIYLTGDTEGLNSTTILRKPASSDQIMDALRSQPSTVQ